MAKPTIVLVHGFWGGAAHWGKVIVQLSKLGYNDIHAVENPLTSLADDAARTKKMIARQKGPVILAGHSYGGAVISEAGDQPNVEALVYIAGWALDVGESIATGDGGLPVGPGTANIAPDSDGYLWINPAKFGESFCQDLPHDEQLVMAVTQKAPLGKTAGDALTTAAWRNKPSFYQISGEDRMIHPDNQRRMAQRLNARKTITLPTSHVSLASKPHDVAHFIDDAAKMTVS